jgi:hypothetical protein
MSAYYCCKEWLQYGFVGYYIDLMLSVDSHYLNDPLPKNIVLSPEERRE